MMGERTLIFNNDADAGQCGEVSGKKKVEDLYDSQMSLQGRDALWDQGRDSEVS
jgi:hypothetical protein